MKAFREQTIFVLALANKTDGIVEDALLVRLRGQFLKAGEKKSVPFLPSVYHGRLAHKPLAWTTAEIERLTQPQTVEVPAGKFSAIVYGVKIADGRAGKFFVEEAYPHRIVRWELPPDISAEPTGSACLEYWRLQNSGDEGDLKSLGIK